MQIMAVIGYENMYHSFYQRLAIVFIIITSILFIQYNSKNFIDIISNNNKYINTIYKVHGGLDFIVLILPNNFKIVGEMVQQFE